MKFQPSIALIAGLSASVGGAMPMRQSKVVTAPFEFYNAPGNPYAMPLVTCGTASGKVKLELDTGSSDTYFNGKELCSQQECTEGVDGSYQGYSTTDFDPIGFNGTMTYTDTTFTKLELGEGAIDLDGSHVKAIFGVASEHYTTPKLGAGFIQNELPVHVANKSYVNLVPGMVEQGLIERAAFGVGGDKIVFGGYDKSWVDGELQSIPLIDRYGAGEEPWHYDVSFNSVTVSAGDDHKVIKQNQSEYMSMDTGVSLFSASRSTIDGIAELLGAKPVLGSDNVTISYFGFPCSNDNVNASILSISLGSSDNEVTLSLPLSKLVYRDDDGTCALLMGYAPKPNMAALGVQILRNHYLVYDLDSNTVSVSKLKTDGGSTSDIVAFDKAQSEQCYM